MPIYNNVISLPITKGDKRLYKPTLIDSNNKAIEGSLLKRGKTYYQEESLEVEIKETCTVNGDFFFGGILFLHYGHFITESLSRLYAWDPEKYDGIVFSIVGPAKTYTGLPKWVISLLSLYKIEQSNIIIITTPTLFNKVTCVTPGFTLNGSFESNLIHYFKGNLAFNKSRMRKINYSKVFVSRSRFSKGNVAGESYLDTVLEKNGFYILHPQNHDIFYQLAVLRGADVLVGIAGSALHSLMLLDKHPNKVVEISRRGGINGTQKIINEALNIKTIIINCIESENSKTSGSAIKIDINKCLYSLKSLGLIDEFIEISNEKIEKEFILLSKYELLSKSLNSYTGKKLLNILTDEEIKILEEVVFSCPSLPSPYFHLAKIKLAENDFLTSLKYLRKAVNLSPKSLGYLCLLRDVYTKLNYFEEVENTNIRINNLDN